MTHYMELLAVNQPWNLIIFMAIPVVLAELLVICEFYILFTRRLEGSIYTISKYAGMFVGVYFLGIIIYLVNTAVIPITQSGEWRTIIDVIAVFSYLLSGVPLMLISLQEFNLINHAKSPEERLKIHAICVSIFLIVGHLAMIFGMASPELLGWIPDPSMGHMNH